MERLGGGLRKKDAAVAMNKRGVALASGKFKLRKDPLLPLSKEQSSRETKPKAKFVTTIGAGATKSSTKPRIFTTNSFIRPPATNGPTKKSSGFSFMKFQSKSKEVGGSSGNPSTKATPLALGGTKPLLSKFSVKKLSNETMSTSLADKKKLFKPQVKKGLPLSFRAETESSVAKKRKAAESIAHDERNAAAFSGLKRFSLKNSATAQFREKEKQSTACAEKAGWKNGIRNSAPFAIKVGGIGVKADDGTAPRKRGLLLTSAIAGSARKRSKYIPQTAVQPLQNTKAIESGSSSKDTLRRNDDLAASLPRMLNLKGMSLEVADSGNRALSNTEAPLSPVECGIEELAVKLECTADDDKEDEFTTRAAAIQEFADRVGLEQKQIRNRLLDAHADVSESLLDALTDLMAEEGGIGIDKLDVDMNFNVDVADAFLRDNKIQIFQQGAMTAEAFT